MRKNWNVVVDVQNYGAERGSAGSDSLPGERRHQTTEDFFGESYRALPRTVL
jgi:hypothetical protein